MFVRKQRIAPACCNPRRREVKLIIEILSRKGRRDNKKSGRRGSDFSVLLKGLALGFERYDLKIIKVNEKKIYVDWNGEDLTFMFPEDY